MLILSNMGDRGSLIFWLSASYRLPHPTRGRPKILGDKFPREGAADSGLPSTSVPAACIILQMLLNITGGRRTGSPRHFKLYETYMRHKLGAGRSRGSIREKRAGKPPPCPPLAPPAHQSWLSLQMNTAIEATYNINVVALSLLLSRGRQSGPLSFPLLAAFPHHYSSSI